MKEGAVNEKEIEAMLIRVIILGAIAKQRRGESLTNSQRAWLEVYQMYEDENE